MIGLVLVTHGRLADEFKAALEHVMGPQKQIEAITIGAEDDSDLCRSDIIEAVNRVDSGDGVAILTDMFGGTPSNLAISCMSRPKVEVLAGINLPMLVKLAKVREERSLPDAISMAQEAGRKYVTIGAEDDSDLCRSDIIEAVNRVDSGDGVAILTDMFGGTPSNLAISCMSRPKVEVLAGINLPMLVKLAKVRDERALPDAIAMAQEAGRKYVTIASRVLAGK